MSQALVESLGEHHAIDAATELDTLILTDGNVHSLGPFGVFKALDGPYVRGHKPSAPQSVEDLSLSPPRGLPQINQSFSHDFEVFHSDEDNEIIPTTIWPEELNLQDLELQFLPTPFWGDLARNSSWTGFQPRGIGDSELCSAPEDLAIDAAYCPPMSPAYSPLRAHPSAVTATEQAPSPSQSVSDPTNITSPGRPGFEVPRPMIDIFGSAGLPSFATPLLRYYRSEVLGSSNLEESRRISPWRQLLLPNALETFAELSIWATTTHARRSILSTLLAKSAFHLHQAESGEPDSSSHWLRVARGHNNDALEHLNTSLRNELVGHNQAPYVEVLMAVLSLVVVTVYFNGTRFVKELLLHAERLIRLRGLPGNKSFSARILHHMYAQLRVLVESTNVAKKGAQIMAESPSFELSKPETDTAVTLHRFQVTRSDLGDLDLARNKPDDVGYADIHLDATGVWLRTLYPDMYGLPESLMTLLSQTVSLANEKPNLEAAARKHLSMSKALTQHIKKLEGCIWSLAAQLSKDSTPSGTGQPSALTYEKLPGLAVHQALLIYFYRRVHNLSANILQSHVQKALEYLGPCMEFAKYDQDYGAGIGWASFIAACEAVTPELQELSLSYLEVLESRGVSIGTDKPVTIAKEVWERRAQAGDMTLSWVEVTFERG